MAARPRPCDRAARAGRLRKAEQFADAYNLVRDYAGDDGELDVADAAVTLAVHAGIAASDVICCARLGVHAQGDSHDEAKALLGAAMAGADKYLATLLAMKTRAGYSADPATRDMLVRSASSGSLTRPLGIAHLTVLVTESEGVGLPTVDTGAVPAGARLTPDVAP